MRAIYGALLLGLSFCTRPVLAAQPVIESASVASPKQPAAAFVIGISPFLDKAVKDDVFRSIVRLMVEQLPLNSTLGIYDAFELKTVARITVPDARAFSSPKTRANQFAPAIRDLKSFLAQEHTPPVSPRLQFAAALRPPQFLDFLAENSTVAGANVLMIGSPLYQDAKEPSFSMVDGYFPSDGHLQATREQSIYGFTGDPATTPHFNISWLYIGDPWMSDLHQSKVERFWTLYLDRRGSALAGFTSDRPSALQSFLRGTEASKPPARNWIVDKTEAKIEMLRIGRSMETADWLTRDNLPANPPPPSIHVGPMKIGIRWKAKIDLDLYATPRPDAETLFFRHVQSPEGYYNKDHRSSPGKEYEFIEFEKPVDIREVEAFVNFYKGDCPGGPRGEVRIEFDGRIYSAPFHLDSEEGNMSRTGKGQQQFWTRIPVQQIVGLHSGLGAAN
jgi:hypothetical protein